MDSAQDAGQPVEDLVEGGDHLFPRERDDGGAHGGEVRLVQHEDHGSGKSAEKRRLPLGDAEQVLEQDVPAHGVVEDRFLLPVAHHEAEGDGPGHLAFHRGEGADARRKQRVQPGRALRGDGEGGEIAGEERLVERLRVRKKRLPALHRQPLPDDQGPGEGRGELRVHVFERGPARELGPVRNLPEAGKDPGHGGAGIEVRQGSHARAREASGHRAHRIPSAASTER